MPSAPSINCAAKPTASSTSKTCISFYPRHGSARGGSPRSGGAGRAAPSSEQAAESAGAPRNGFELDPMELQALLPLRVVELEQAKQRGKDAVGPVVDEAAGDAIGMGGVLLEEPER